MADEPSQDDWLTMVTPYFSFYPEFPIGAKGRVSLSVLKENLEVKVWPGSFPIRFIL
jgi:hypothetical protein